MVSKPIEFGNKEIEDIEKQLEEFKDDDDLDEIDDKSNDDDYGFDDLW